MRSICLSSRAMTEGRGIVGGVAQASSHVGEMAEQWILPAGHGKAQRWCKLGDYIKQACARVQALCMPTDSIAYMRATEKPACILQAEDL